MNDVIRDIEDLEKIIIRKQEQAAPNMHENAIFCVARAILKLALVHAGNNVEDVCEKKHEVDLDEIGPR